MGDLSSEQLNPLDVAFGFAFGMVDRPPLLPPPASSIATAVGDLLLRHLTVGRCLVAFSGGQDSSAVLALASTVAARHGLDPPIPISYRFPRHAAASEEEYQVAVVEHLGLTDWVRIDIDDELDCTGAWAQEAVEMVGLRWPFNTFFMLPLARHASGGSLISGVGGDEILTPGPHGQAAMVLTGGRRPRRKDVRPILRALAPRIIPARSEELSPAPSWLTADGLDLYRHHSAELRRRQPWQYDRATVGFGWRSRYVQQSRASLAAVGAAAGCAVSGFFMEPELISTCAAELGRRGPVSRAAMLETLCQGSLPPVVAQRTTKAEFSSVFWGPRARSFAAAVQPEELAVDLAVIDPGRLVTEWRRPTPDSRSRLLAQRFALLPRTGGLTGSP